MRVAASGAVLVGIPAGSYFAARTVWESPPNNPWTLLLALAVLALHWAIAILCIKSGEDIGVAGAVFMVVLSLAWLGLVNVQGDMRDDQRMHDQGVSEQAVVAQLVRTSDPFGGVKNQVTAIVVRLPGGGCTSLELKGAPVPRLGESMQVTWDPGGRIPTRFGGRPEAPGSGLATTFLVFVLVLTLLPAAGAAVFTYE
ncbi:hypothetical protein ACFWSF_26475 [Streptomyces sp. NPDC058611]|uniref:hypothetical protein n=1 Tax=unclassified Streptomyces TaxID=2593676 RepID=UPI003658611D